MQYIYKHIALFLVAASFMFMFTACDRDTSSTGTFEVRLHDAPGDYQELWVDIQRVEVNNSNDEGSGWVTISEPGQRYDILTLTNGASELLGSAELEEGTYQQIRLILGDNNTLVYNDEELPVTVPSGSQSGLKLNINATIEGDVVYTLWLDFHADRSIVRTGQGNNFLLKPVIRAYAQAETGIIAGIIEPADMTSWVYAISGSDTLSTTRSEVETGEFKLLGIPEGSYTVSVVPTDEETESVQIEDVAVELSETTDVGTVSFTSN